MNATRITNVILVAIYFLKEYILGDTSTHLMKAKNITNVNLEVNYFHKQNEHFRKHISTFHGGHKNYKCESCDIPFINLQALEECLQVVHDEY